MLTRRALFVVSEERSVMWWLGGQDRGDAGIGDECGEHGGHVGCNHLASGWGGIGPFGLFIACYRWDPISMCALHLAEGSGAK